MLLLDGPAATFNDLTLYESSIVDVAVALQIDLTKKIEVTTDRLYSKLRLFLKRNSDGQFSLENIVVTPELRHWLILRALAEVYRDAFHFELNDRYGAKWRAFVHESQEAENELYQIGVAVTNNPLRRPNPPSVEVIGGTEPARTYYVCTAWVSLSGEESAPSELVVADAPDASNVLVSPGETTDRVAGWVVYVGTSDGSFRLQTPTPLALGESWTVPEGGLRNGVLAGTGQEPDSYIVSQQRMWR